MPSAVALAGGTGRRRAHRARATRSVGADVDRRVDRLGTPCRLRARRRALGWVVLTAPCTLVLRARGAARRALSSVAGQHGEDAFDVVAELLHEVGEERRGRLVGDLAVVGDEPRPEGHVGLGRGHLAGVAEAEDAAEALLG